MLRILVVSTVVVLVAKTSMRVTRLDRDYSYVRPNQVFANHMRQVLQNLNLFERVHPRVRHLYDLLQTELRAQGPELGYAQRHDASEILDSKTIRTVYDDNKLNRIFTTESYYS